jgi:hypothetical protein
MGEMGIGNGKKARTAQRYNDEPRALEVGPLGRTHYGRIILAEVFSLPLVYGIAVKL